MNVNIFEKFCLLPHRGCLPAYSKRFGLASRLLQNISTAFFSSSRKGRLLIGKLSVDFSH